MRVVVSSACDSLLTNNDKRLLVRVSGFANTNEQTFCDYVYVYFIREKRRCRPGLRFNCAVQHPLCYFPPLFGCGGESGIASGSAMGEER